MSTYSSSTNSPRKINPPLYVEVILDPSFPLVASKRPQRCEKKIRCGGEFSYRSPSLRPAVCTYPDCGKVLSTRGALSRHMARHTEIEPPIVCSHPGCGRRFWEKFHMQSHEILHSDPSVRHRFRCTIPGCGRSYGHSSSLRAHLLEHKNIYRYHCDFPGCERRFRFAQNFKEHRSVHLEPSQRPYTTCPYPGCEKRFFWSASLKYHMYSHTGNYPFKCKHPGCDYKTAESKKYKNHCRKRHNADEHREINKPIEKVSNGQDDDSNPTLLESNSEVFSIHDDDGSSCVVDSNN